MEAMVAIVASPRFWTTLVGLCFVGLLPSESCFAQAAPAAFQNGSDLSRGAFVNSVYVDQHGAHKYVVFVPANYSPRYKWPVILYLHGASNRGTDGRAPLVSGLAPAIRLNPAAFPFLVVFPQCE